MEKYLPDTSVVIEEILSKQVAEGKIKGRILIPNAVVAELEHQANTGQEIGLIGLEEIKRLRELSEKGKIELEFVGDRPDASQIKYAKKGEIDAMIRKLAFENNATLVTGDLVQARSGEAFGIKVIYYDLRKIKKKLGISRFFTKDTMSIHLKEGVRPMAKKGAPGVWEFVEIRKKKLKREEVESYAKEIMEAGRIPEYGFIEIDRKGSTIAQIGKYRIVITKPPFSEGWEITATRPIREMELKDYGLPKKLLKRLDEEASGIIISGSPGAGKTTFAEALARHHQRKGRIVKTIEAPRDLQLPEEITQYSKTLSSTGELHDILLLTRPDYTIFDEVRTTSDFKLYADLRLAGIGLIGVLHGTSAIDSIQRFLGKIELGMVPSIIDTIIFIDKGNVAKVYSMKMVVKVPTGMYESDLARPVVEVRDFLTGELEYEMYTYGEQTVVMPVRHKKKIKFKEFESEIRALVKKPEIEVIDNSVVIKVSKAQIKRLLGKKGERIRRLEKKYGVSIEVITK